MSWETDKLDRKLDGDFLTNYLSQKFENTRKEKSRSSFVLNVNAEWGFGKTYFLKNWKKDLESSGFAVVYFDAWASDFAEEPLLAFISEIDDGLQPYFNKSKPAKALLGRTLEIAKKLVKPSGPVLLALLAKKMTGMTVEELAEYFETDPGEDKKGLEDAVSTVIGKAAEQALKNHNDKKKSIQTFRDSLGKLTDLIDKEETAEFKLPLFVFVDELDRCRPTYALELLENIKHLFGVHGVYFVVATDYSQLVHSIKSVYGSSFDSDRYLRRFFDQEYVLEEPKNIAFAEFLFVTKGLDKSRLFSPLSPGLCESKDPVVELFSRMAGYFNLSLRDQEQCFVVLDACLLTCKEKELHFAYILFLIMLKQRSRSKFDEYIKAGSWGARTKIINEMTGLSRGKTIKSYSKRRAGEFSNSTVTEETFDNLITCYHGFAGQDLHKLGGAQESSSITHETIRMKILSQLPHTYRGDPPKPNFEAYFGLVDRAGKLS